MFAAQLAMYKGPSSALIFYSEFLSTTDAFFLTATGTFTSGAPFFSNRRLSIFTEVGTTIECSWWLDGEGQIEPLVGFMVPHKISFELPQCRFSSGISSAQMKANIVNQIWLPRRIWLDHVYSKDFADLKDKKESTKNLFRSCLSKASGKKPRYHLHVDWILFSFFIMWSRNEVFIFTCTFFLFYLYLPHAQSSWKCFFRTGLSLRSVVRKNIWALFRDWIYNRNDWESWLLNGQNEVGFLWRGSAARYFNRIEYKCDTASIELIQWDVTTITELC